MLLNNNFTVIQAVEGVIDLLGKQGTTWGPLVIVLNIGGAPANLEGYSIRGQMRKNITSPISEEGLEFSISGPAAGEISMGMDAVHTAALACGASSKDPASSYVWDAEIYKESVPEEVYRYFGGRIYVEPEVTRTNG